MHDDRRAGLGGDLGGVADVIVMGMADQDGVCSLHLVEPKAERAHPRAAVIEGVEQENPVTEGQLVVCCSEPADRQDIGVWIDGSAQHRRTAVAEDRVMVHVRSSGRVDPLII